MHARHATHVSSASLVSGNISQRSHGQRESSSGENHRALRSHVIRPDGQQELIPSQIFGINMDAN